jgi:cellulose synthase/poly-beta-1,6-N-acetylglucosamine synthase-like glycosyltransferase
MTDHLTKTIEFGGCATLSVALLALGFLTGTQTEVVTVDTLFVSIRMAFVDALTSVLLFTGFVVLTGSLLVAEVYRTREPDATLTDGPPITAIVPVYRDADVLANSVESLVDSNYENLRVLILSEYDDEATQAEADRLAEIDCVEHVTNGNPGSKAGAINFAVEYADADHFAVFDADEVIAPEFIGSGAYYLHETDYEVFQGRRVPQPDGWVETLAYCERVVFHASYKIVELLGFANCRSSSTMFTRTAFDAVDGYDDMLTEDLDFAHKCYRKGVDVKQARNYTNKMEAPHTLADLWGQRKRWRIGQIEVFHKTVRELPTADHPVRTLVSLLRVSSGLVGTVFLLILASKVLVLLLVGLELVFLSPLASTVVLVALVAYRDADDGMIDGVPASAALTPLIYPFFGLMTLKCAMEYLVSWEGEWYHVQKTGS